MGQHKHNPTAIAAARGEIPPKPPKKSKRQRDSEMLTTVLAMMEKNVPGMAVITMGMIGGNRDV